MDQSNRVDPMTTNQTGFKRLAEYYRNPSQKLSKNAKMFLTVGIIALICFLIWLYIKHNKSSVPLYYF